MLTFGSSGFQRGDANSACKQLCTSVCCEIQHQSKVLKTNKKRKKLERKKETWTQRTLLPFEDTIICYINSKYINRNKLMFFTSYCSEFGHCFFFSL